MLSNPPLLYGRAHSWIRAGLDDHNLYEDVEEGCHQPIENHEKRSRGFSGSSNQVIVDLIPTVDVCHLLVGLVEEVKLSTMKIRSRSVAKKAGK